MVSFLNLKGVLCALAICKLTHGHTLQTPVSSHNVPNLVGHSIEPTRAPLSHPNVPSAGHYVEATPTPASSSNVPTPWGHSVQLPDNLVRRERWGFCDDMCARGLDGSAQSVKVDFENHCSSFLGTTVGPTVVTTTSTTTITVFENNGHHNIAPSTVSKANREIQIGTDELLTIVPTYIPSHVPLHWPACADRKYTGQLSLFTKQFRSLCSCRGVMPITTTVATATNTVIEASPTTAPFKLKAVFDNRTTEYLQPFVDKFRPTMNPAIKAIGFDKTADIAPIFDLTPDKHLKSRNNELLGWMPPSFWSAQVNGKLTFIEETYAKKHKALLPLFHIEPEIRGGKWYYNIAVEGEDVEFWAVSVPSSNETLPDENLLLLQTYDQVQDLKEQFSVIVDKVQLLAEPVS